MRMEFSQQGRVVADACKEMGLPLAELRTLPGRYHFTSLPVAVAGTICSIGVGHDAQVKQAIARFAGHLGISPTVEPSLVRHGCLTILGGLRAHSIASDVFANRGRTSTGNGILKATAAELSREFPFMTPQRLDYAIWSWQRAQGRELPPNEVAAQA